MDVINAAFAATTEIQHQLQNSRLTCSYSSAGDRFLYTALGLMPLSIEKRLLRRKLESCPISGKLSSSTSGAFETGQQLTCVAGGYVARACAHEPLVADHER